MDLFRGSIIQNNAQGSEGVLAHLGSFRAAAVRIESMFVVQKTRIFDGKRLNVFNGRGDLISAQNPDEALNDFIRFLNKTIITRFNVDINNPFRLIDCWLDDPIGSGAMKILPPRHGLTPENYRKFRNIFFPFNDIIYPDQIKKYLKPEAIKKIHDLGFENEIYRRELAKRKSRYEHIGVDFNVSANHEAVWIYLTLKLREWAMEHGYDAFVYANTKEGLGEDSYITLEDDQLEHAFGRYKFNEKKYRKIVNPQAFKEFLRKTWKENKRSVKASHQKSDMFWAGHDPSEFWTPA